MARVELDSVILNRVRRPSDYVRLPAVQIPQRHRREGQVKTYAGGFRRAIIMEERSRDLQIVCERVSRQVVEKVESWIGQPLLLRDTLQHMTVGVIFNISRTDSAEIATDYHDLVDTVSFTLHEVTFYYGV